MNLRRKKGSCSRRMHSLPREKRTQRDRERPPRRQRQTGARIPPSLYRRVNEGHLKRGGAAEIERERRRKPGPKKTEELLVSRLPFSAPLVPFFPCRQQASPIFTSWKKPRSLSLSLRLDLRSKPAELLVVDNKGRGVGRRRWTPQI